MFHQKAADSGIFSQAFYHRLHLKPGGFKLAVPGFRIISCHIVLGVISGYDHKGSQNHLGRIIFFYHPHQAFHGRISLYRAKENIFVAFVLKGVIQGSVNRVGIMGGTVAHKYQHLILGKVRKFIGNCLDHCKIVFCAGEERIPEGDGVKIITVSQGVSKSSNIGTSKIALEMQPQTLWQMYNDLGFGTPPQTGFPGATGGRLRPAKSWRPIEQATISYGHGISVSLMQLVRAYTALARNGDVIDLTFRRTSKEAVGRQIFRPEVARQMRAMMAETVQAGTARRVNVQGYTVAGKTGTANKIENGQYVDKYVASFVGMAPAGQPRLIVAVMIDEPTRGSYYGGAVAAPVFNEVTAGALRLIGVHPDAAGFGAAPGILVRGQRND